MALRKNMLSGVASVGLLVFAWYIFKLNIGSISPLVQMLGTGVVAGVISQLLIWWKEHSREEENAARDRRFIALQLAVTLERYAIECAMRISRISDILEHFYENATPISEIPTLPSLELPTAADWRWIAPHLASEIMSLAPKIGFGTGSIQYIYNIVDEHDAAEEAQRQLGLVGHAAWLLGVRLRAEHDIPPQAYVLGQWNFERDLEKHAADF